MSCPSGNLKGGAVLLTVAFLVGFRPPQIKKMSFELPLKHNCSYKSRLKLMCALHSAAVFKAATSPAMLAAVSKLEFSLAISNLGT